MLAVKLGFSSRKFMTMRMLVTAMPRGRANSDRNSRARWVENTPEVEGGGTIQFSRWEAHQPRTLSFCGTGAAVCSANWKPTNPPWLAADISRRWASRVCGPAFSEQDRMAPRAAL